MRKNIKSIVFILEIAIAGISLPMSIISIIYEPEQEFYTITAYNLTYYESVILSIPMEEGDVFSYNWTQERSNRVMISCFALTSIEGYDDFGNGHYPNSTERDYLNQHLIEFDYYGSGYYQANSTRTWYFLFYQGSTLLEYLTITYTIF
jgi:hypothetical protein